MIGPLKLLIDPADGAPFEHTFDTDSMVIGRAATSDLLIPDPFLSRHHARFFLENGQLLVEDLGSRNGTEVSGVLITKPTPVRLGDVIRVSGSRIDIGHQHSNLATTDLKATVLRPAIEFLRGADLDTKGDHVDAKRLRSYAERLHRLNTVYRLIGATLSLRDLEAVLLQTMLELLQPEHAALFLLQPDGSFAQTATLSSKSASNRPPPLSMSLVEQVCHRSMSALITDMATDHRFADSQSLIMSGTQSLAAAPLLDEDGSLGMVVISSTATIRDFKEEDLELLTSIASVAALKIKNLRLARAANERERQKRELRMARRIQESLLPQTLPNFPHLELFARNTPSRGVSGDFFQITSRFDGRQCLILVVDVSGKGVPAALLTASIEALVAAPIEDNKHPEEIFSAVSRRLYRRSPPEKYATAFLAVLDVETGAGAYANAGHNPPLLVRADGSCERLDLAGPPLGLLEGSTYQAGSLVMDRGDTLVAYTDGLTEAENVGGEQYSTARLIESATRHHEASIDQLGEGLLADIETFAGGHPPTDDCTVVIARSRRV